jgi:hypothetical protein
MYIATQGERILGQGKSKRHAMRDYIQNLDTLASLDTQRAFEVVYGGCIDIVPCSSDFAELVEFKAGCGDLVNSFEEINSIVMVS